jgi:peptidoglycan hydrolase-like protein with peptidoglycan-binding domain
MVFSLIWLPDVLQRAGLVVSEVPDWRTRGLGNVKLTRGVIVHHTVGPAKGNMPSLDLLIRGSAKLGGPLAQLGLGRDGTFYVIAAGLAQHAGKGSWKGITAGNSSFIGIECENTGAPSDAWPEKQLAALERGTAAILQHIKADAQMACGHKEWAPGRKIDPLWDMNAFRGRVATLLAAGVPMAPQIPAIDDQSRPTLRRGSRGQLVEVLQAALGVETVGNFGPVTEAKVREFQRAHGLVGDGIVGPKTWSAIDVLKAKGVAAIQTSTDAGAAQSATTTMAAAINGTKALPTADDATHVVKTDATRAFSPDGKVFARRRKLGFMNIGTTDVAALLRDDPAAANGVSASAVRAIDALTGNEGKIEAINSYDNAFMSFGIMQWTAGAGAGEGELAALLARIRRTDAVAFEECFGRFGLDCAVASSTSTTGRLTIAGKALMTGKDKTILRTATWAYRFWRAAHHPVVRSAQLAQAASRFDQFATKIIEGHPVSAWLTSELGMAHLLDEHVNRPSHVPDTLAVALRAVLAAGSAKRDPAQWSTKVEEKLVQEYLRRRAGTTMTDSPARANRLASLASAGKLSTERNSFA